MRHLKYLTLLAFLALPLAACDDDEGTVAPVEGSVRGTVTIEGQPAQGVTVELRGTATQTTTTNANGAYEFTAVEAGAYQVDIAGFPADATFSATSKAAVISTAGQQVTVDFSGQFIRTSSIVTTVTAGDQALAGVTVSLTGAGSASGATNAQGVYTATGLRAGTYTVAISGYPADVQFGSASQNITVGVGQTAQVGFVGNRPSNATVAIAGIVSQATGLPINPTAVAGVIAITLAVDPDGDTPQLLEAFLNDDKVYTQTFSQAALEAMAEEAGAEDAPFNVTFSVNTAEYDAETGAVRFPNGMYVASATFQTVEGGSSNAAQTQTDLTFANEDIILIDVTPGQSAFDENGLRWLGQGLTADFTHVAYSGQQATNFFSSLVDDDVVGATAYPASGRSVNPAVWTPANLMGLNSANFVGDEGAPLFIAVQAIVDGEPGPRSYQPVRYDGERPAVGVVDGLANDFVLTEQLLDGTVRAASNNWINPAYEFAAGAPDVSDDLNGFPGVGGLVVTYHAGPAGSTDAQLAALAEAETPAGAGLAPSLVNTTYSVVARVADALGNVRLQRVQPTLTNPSQTFGHDNVAPEDQDFAVTTTVEDRTIYNTVNIWASGQIDLQAVDDVAGFSAHPVALQYRSNNRDDGLVCLIGDDCTPVQRPLPFATDVASSFDGALSDEAYYQYWGEVYDQAGNGSGTPSIVTFLNDITAPDVDNIAGTAGTFAAGQNYTFSAVASDNVDLAQAQFSLVFDGLTGTPSLDAVPLGGPETLGTGWDFEAPTFTATAMATVPWISGVETTAADAPSGVLTNVSWARFVVDDIAGNQSTQQNNFVVGSYPAPVSFGAGAAPLFPAGATFQQTTAAQDLCLNADNDCGPAPETRVATITATATGASGTFQNPFSAVLFAYVDASVAAPTHRFIHLDTSATVTDDGVTRTWTWSTTLPASALPAATAPGALSVQAIGVNFSTATALLAATDTNINVVAN